MSIAEEYGRRIDESNKIRNNELILILKEKDALKEVEELIQILISPYEAYRIRNKFKLE